jgi:excisionase family DNA binding protein
MNPRIGLRPAEIAAALAPDTSGRGLPAILDVPQVAELLGLSPKTIYHWVAAGRFDGTFRKRGKHLRFWRDRVVDRFFNGPDWSFNENKSAG